MSDGASVDSLATGHSWDPSVARKRTMLARPPMAMLSSFPPRECGIATFARDLMGAIEGASYLHLRNLARLASPPPWVIAMNEAGQTYTYGSQVRLVVDRDRRADYRRAAERINESARTQVVSVQHEYGLFGGEYGDYLLDFIDAVQRPVVLTMHTVLERPDAALRRVTEALINKSSAVIVQAESARHILNSYYRRADLTKVGFIPHGTPGVRRESSERYKVELGLDGYTVLSTFGLLGPDKGIEYAIRALPDIVARHPDVVYLVLGETHPGQRKYAGESYREMLIGLVDELGLQEHVRFYDRYLSQPELLRFLQATDIYVIPYLNPQQIVSGTLAYAVACGKAVVATPFVYAREMLAEGRGVLTSFRDSASIGKAVTGLLDDSAAKAHMEQLAYNHGLRMHWPAVGVAYCRLLRRVVDEHHASVRAERAARRHRRTIEARRPAAISPLGVGLGLPAARPVVASSVATALSSSRRAARPRGMGVGVSTLGTGINPLFAGDPNPDMRRGTPRQ
jgi:polysaccharide biosynthesis protein PslF